MTGVLVLVAGHLCLKNTHADGQNANEWLQNGNYQKTKKVVGVNE